MAITPNRAAIRLWVDALRSGEYEQGIGKLYGDGKYCCLGVACEVALREGAISALPWQIGVEDDNLDDFEDMHLNGPMQEWLGLGFDPAIGEKAHECEEDVCVVDTEEISATSANDTMALTFDEIADLIEKRYLADA